MFVTYWVTYIVTHLYTYPVKKTLKVIFEFLKNSEFGKFYLSLGVTNGFLYCFNRFPGNHILIISQQMCHEAWESQLQLDRLKKMHLEEKCMTMYECINSSISVESRNKTGKIRK